MYWSRTLIPTAKEVPADAEVLSHKLMIRAGLVRKLSAGVYDFLPLGWRVMQKIFIILREEMANAGADEVMLPALLPANLWKQTRRYFDYGPLLFHVHDRKESEMVLGPTHEEIMTELAHAYVSSYKQLPLVLYQIQQKFRDEARPRNGLLRVREFFMKDAYSFHASVESLQETYAAMYRAYVNIFRRCGVKAIPVEAESGPIGGDASHEFITPCDAGEDIIVTAADGSYAANLERAAVSRPPMQFSNAPAVPAVDLERAYTPATSTIAEVCAKLNVGPAQTIKTLIFQAPEAAANRWVVACVRGDHEVNEAKLAKVAGAVALAGDVAAQQAGFAVGFVGPHIVNSHANALLVIDPDALMIPIAVAGANEPDYHVTNFNWLNHVSAAQAGRAIVADIRQVNEHDKAPSGAALAFSRGIEMGHVFKLGTKYSEALGATFLDEKQQSHPMIMGCYGIGPGRIVVAALETLSDENGIRWPMAIAPYHVIITPIKYENNIKETCDRLHAELTALGVDVLVDDRDQRPGVKFKDADLIGIPLRVVVGDKTLALGQAEVKRRDRPEAQNMPLEGLAETIAAMVREAKQTAAP